MHVYTAARMRTQYRAVAVKRGRPERAKAARQQQDARAHARVERRRRRDGHHGERRAQETAAVDCVEVCVIEARLEHAQTHAESDKVLRGRDVAMVEQVHGEPGAGEDEVEEGDAGMEREQLLPRARQVAFRVLPHRVSLHVHLHAHAACTYTSLSVPSWHVQRGRVTYQTRVAPNHAALHQAQQRWRAPQRALGRT